MYTLDTFLLFSYFMTANMLILTATRLEHLIDHSSSLKILQCLPKHKQPFRC